MSERYNLHTPVGIYELDGTARPAVMTPYATSNSLVRAYGYRQMYDLKDGFPDATPITLTGEMEAPSEDELSRDQRTFRRAARMATAFDRDGRKLTPISAAYLVFTPTGDDSNVCAFTLTLMPTQVPDPDDADIYDW